MQKEKSVEISECPSDMSKIESGESANYFLGSRQLCPRHGLSKLEACSTGVKFSQCGCKIQELRSYEKQLTESQNKRK